MSRADDTKIRPPIALPEDGPRYHQEHASAALLRSTYRPMADSNLIDCPDCRTEWLTLDGVAAHWTDEHADGRWRVDE